MNAYQKVTAEMDRLISENEALAYRLPMPPDEVTDNNELQGNPSQLLIIPNLQQ